ncbi:hypothetical protein ACFXG6_12540 [Streptomyces roseus]|uniref:hypothetical protein n=1 Tax=Streptomyces roseus TaxID=66430 RepID=UPI00369F7622
MREAGTHAAADGWPDGRFDAPAPDRAAAPADVRAEVMASWTGPGNGDAAAAAVVALAGLGHVAGPTARRRPAPGR